MKTNNFFMAALALLMVGSISAQTESSQLQFGAKVGANYSNVYDSQGQEYKADGKFGFVAGGFLSIPIGTYFGIQPELLFSQKGYQATGTVFGSDVSFTRTSNYIDVPIFFTVKPDDLVTIMIGPQYSYLMSQKDVFLNPISNSVVQEDFNTDNIRKNTVCLVTGFDVNLDRIVIGARVGWDLFNNNGDGTSTTPNNKNVYGQATIGFRL